jgi:hypothetical protein
MRGCLMQMPQLVGIAHHVDRGDPAILDVECRRLQFVISLQCHEIRQAIELADGRTDITIPHFRRRDEIGAMAVVVQAFKENKALADKLALEQHAEIQSNGSKVQCCKKMVTSRLLASRQGKPRKSSLPRLTSEGWNWR